MANENEPGLTLDEAYRAAYHFVLQYYDRQQITPFMLMLHSMQSSGGDLRETNDPATWTDWLKSVEKARGSKDLPVPEPPLD